MYTVSIQKYKPHEQTRMYSGSINLQKLTPSSTTKNDVVLLSEVKRIHRGEVQETTDVLLAQWGLN